MNAKDKIRATKAISIMLNSFPQQGSIDPAMQLVSFLECVDGYSAEAVEETCLRYRRGEVVGHDARFAPSTAQFTQTVKERQGYIEMRDRPRLPAPKPKPPEKMVSKEKMQALADAAAGIRSWGSIADEFGTPSKEGRA